MGEIRVTELRRNRKKKQVIVNKKTLIYVIFQISILSMILLFPVFSQSLVAHQKTLLALCTLFLFAGSIIYLSIRLLMMVSDWMGSGKHARSVAGDDHLQNSSLLCGLGGVLTIFIWAFVLNLLHPFIVTMVWWQGYTLMEGKAFSLGEVAGTVRMIESLVYFAIVLFLLLLSRPYWNCGRRNSCIPKLGL